MSLIKVHSFGAGPKGPDPRVDPEGYSVAKARVRKAYTEAYASYWREKIPDNGLPVRFTVYLEELPDTPASYEMGAVALLQRQERE